MPTFMLLLGLIAWIVPTIAGVWYLLTFRVIRDEIRLIRRYIQLLHERESRRQR